MNWDDLKPDPALLVRRCRLGSARAFRQLVEEYRGAVMERVRNWSLRRKLFRPDLLDDALQDLWCALLKSGCRPLEGYRADRGSLEDYLAALAWDHVHRRLREEGRRRRRQDAAGRPRTSGESNSLDLELAEVVSLLSPTERAFFQEWLLGLPPDEQPLALTGANAWQLKHRILQKVLAYLEQRAEQAPRE